MVIIWRIAIFSNIPNIEPAFIYRKEAPVRHVNVAQF